MSWLTGSADLIGKYGQAARVVVSGVLNVVAPGSGTLLDLAGKALDQAGAILDSGANLCEKSQRERWEAELAARLGQSEAELTRLGQLLECLVGPLAILCDKAAAFANQPDNLPDILGRAIAADPALRQGLAHVQSLTVQFARLHAEQQRQGQTLQDIYQAVLQLLNGDRSPQHQPPISTEELLRLGQEVQPGQYDESLSTDNPSCLLILVDQSRSMKRPFGRQRDLRKADGVAVSINWILGNLCQEVGTEKDRLFVGVFGYGAGTGSPVNPILDGGLAKLLAERRSKGEPELVSTRELHANKLQEVRVVKKKGQPPRKAPIWVTPCASGNQTPMREAFEHARRLLEVFLERHPKCFPPIVLHFTDGQPNTGDPTPQADALRRLASANGNVLLFNAHVSDQDAEPIVFPRDVSALPRDDRFARQMFAMSSILPDALVQNALLKHIRIERGGRCFAFNGDLDSVVKMLQVGTTSFTGSTQDLRQALQDLPAK